ncbi:MAG: hypothetical protein VKS61_01260 [Candidatus Sericytochromatia bacterium]|nr:hypothetical protein [Candidatus Sericytochromatia bacterium]
MLSTIFTGAVTLLLAVGAPPADAAPAVPLGASERSQAADWHAPLVGELRARGARAAARKQRAKERRLIGTGEAVGSRPVALQ